MVTLKYPEEKWTPPDRFRGRHIHLTNEDGKPLCIACGLCEKACPSDCISLGGEKPEGGKKKELTKYLLDFTKCSLCGSCVEACSFSAIDFSKEYNLARTRKEDFYFDLLKRLEDKK